MKRARRIGSRRLSREARVQPDRHHPRAVVAVVAQPVDRRLRVFEEVLRAAVALREHVAGVVDDERVRHDEVGLPVHGRPVGKVVVVALRVVEEAAFLDDQLARVDAHLAAVPAERARAHAALDRLDAEADRLALLVAGHLEVVRPAVAVAGGLVAPRRELRGHGRVALERDRGREERDRHAGAVEEPEQAPDAGPRAVLVDGLDAQVADPLEVERDLVHAVVDPVAHRERLLGALLVVDDDLHRHLRVAGPADARRVLPVPDVVARRALRRAVLPHEELLVHRSSSTRAASVLT